MAIRGAEIHAAHEALRRQSGRRGPIGPAHIPPVAPGTPRNTVKPHAAATVLIQAGTPVGPTTPEEVLKKASGVFGTKDSSGTEVPATALAHPHETARLTQT